MLALISMQKVAINGNGRVIPTQILHVLENMCNICAGTPHTAMKTEFVPIAVVPARRGRGAAFNPAGRFQRLHLEENPAALEDQELRQVTTQLFADTSKSALARNTSPDVPFTYSLNPYRGCEHGCIYCYARPSHEYLGFSAGIDFESKIVVKHEAPALLASTLERRSWQPQVVALSGNTDPYQPAERKLEITRRCLEIFLEYRNPVSVITKSRLVVRDIDLLAELAASNLVRVTVSVTTLRPELARVMEPRAAAPEARLAAIESIANAGVPVGVNVAPVIPGLTDEEMPLIMKRARDAGATRANYILMRLPGPVKPLFLEWLHREFPARAGRVISRLREVRGDSLTDPRFGKRHRGEGEYARLLDGLFRVTARRLGMGEMPVLSIEHFRRRRERQMGLFRSA